MSDKTFDIPLREAARLLGRDKSVITRAAQRGALETRWMRPPGIKPYRLTSLAAIEAYRRDHANDNATEQVMTIDDLKALAAEALAHLGEVDSSHEDGADVLELPGAFSVGFAERLVYGGFDLEIAPADADLPEGFAVLDGDTGVVEFWSVEKVPALIARIVRLAGTP